MIDWLLILTVGSFVAAVVTAVVAWLTLSRQSPRRALEYELSVAPLVRLSDDRLLLYYADHLLSDPQVVSFKMRSSSRADIASSSFNAGDPIRMDFGAEIVGQSFETGNLTTLIRGSELQIPPQLIKPGDSVQATLVFGEAPVMMKPTQPLIDIKIWSAEEIRHRRRARWRRIKVALSLIGVLLGVGAIAAITVAWVASSALTTEQLAKRPAILRTTTVYEAPQRMSVPIEALPAGQLVKLKCFVVGQAVAGDPIWYHLAGGGWVSDSDVLTGSNSPVRPPCN